jgi:hypothetical protein
MGTPYAVSSDLVSAWPAKSLAVATYLDSALAAKAALAGTSDVSITKATPKLALRDTGASQTALFLSSGDGLITFAQTGYSNAFGAIAFSTNNSEKLRIGPDGAITGTGPSLGAWVSFVPVVSGTGWSVGTGATITGYVCKIGKTVHWRIEFVIGSTGIGSGSLFLSMPHPVAGWHNSHGAIYDTSIATFYEVIGRRDLDTIEVMYRLTTVALAGVTNSAPISIAAGDVLEIGGSYEAA